ncbi:MAG: twin-arginine translocation pathway signal protein [Candidatus Accumulibacter sp.]|nr:twin-arginine translocation pathway signal protein [Accumulibacter sp.]MBA4094362.1 twin-arginine translocation pathway signal protein [Accumulibacter sp.]
MNRRKLLKLSALVAAGFSSTPLLAQGEPPSTDGTPAQFLPKKPADPAPTENDLEKYPKCPYCGMDRRYNHRSRMLIHYSNDLPDATCSIHCAAVSLALNLTLDPKAIYVGDNASDADPRPLVDVEKATFLVGSDLPGVMTKRSKVAYSSAEAARQAQATHGGELADYPQTLRVAYTDLADDVAMIRKNREERRKRGAQQKQG